MEDADRDRLTRLEMDVRSLERTVADVRASLGRWTMSLIIALLGAAVTVTGTLISGAIAYGELRQQAATSERLLTEMRGELRELSQNVRAAH